MITPSVSGRVPPGTCVVWWASLSDVQPWHDDVLSDLERNRRDRLRRPGDRSRQTVGAVLLRLAAARALSIEPRDVPVQRGCPDCAAPHGRPSISGSQLEVSVSHSGDRVAVVVSRAGPVGVDVEAVMGVVHSPAMASSVLSAAELARGRIGPAGFFTYWTRKESVVKATGDGLRIPLSRVEVSAPEDPPRLIHIADRPEVIPAAHMYELGPGAGYAAALTVLGRPTAVSEHAATTLLADPASVVRAPGNNEKDRRGRPAAPTVETWRAPGIRGWPVSGADAWVGRFPRAGG